MPKYQLHFTLSHSSTLEVDALTEAALNDAVAEVTKRREWEEDGALTLYEVTDVATGNPVEVDLDKVWKAGLELGYFLKGK